MLPKLWYYDIYFSKMLYILLYYLYVQKLFTSTFRYYYNIRNIYVYVNISKNLADFNVLNAILGRGELSPNGDFRSNNLSNGDFLI